jgi:hypothetical protein
MFRSSASPRLPAGAELGAGIRRFPGNNQLRRKSMPVFILWAIPAVVILGGGAYWIAHLH